MKKKICTKCGVEYPVTPEYFYRHRGTADGLFYWCKKCKRKYDRKHKKEHREYMRKYYKEHKKQIREYWQEYRQEHKKQYKEYDRKHRQTIKGYLGVVWYNINKRCNNPKCNAYHWYGGRGIKNRFKSLNNFRDYVINELGFDTYDKIKGLQIDRIDNNGHYEKGNIRFVTPKQNSNNRR